jgi:hypothetical protein
MAHALTVDGAERDIDLDEVMVNSSHFVPANALTQATGPGYPGTVSANREIEKPGGIGPWFRRNDPLKCPTGRCVKSCR